MVDVKSTQRAQLRRRSLWALAGVLSIILAVLGQRYLAGQQYVLDGALYLGLGVILFLIATTRNALPPALWPQNHAPIDSEPAMEITRRRRILLGAAALLAALAFVSLADNQWTRMGLLAWLGSIACWWLALARWPSVSRYEFGRWAAGWGERVQRGHMSVRVSWTSVILLAILALSLFFRVYRIDSLPPEAQSDHVEASEDIRSILNGDYMIFFPRNTGREGTQFYLTALLSHVFGYGFFTLKLTMALVGSLNVIPMYFLGKEVWDRRLGLLSAFFLAVSYWHVIVSRIAWRISLAPFWTTLTLYFLLRAFRTGKRNDYMLTGLMLGAGLYGYMSFRITPLLILALFALKLLFDREDGFRMQRFVGHGLLLVGTAILVYLPLLRYMYDEPKMYWYRSLTRTTDLELAIQRNEFEVFVDNVRRAFLMFNWVGDAGWVQSVPHRPILDLVSGGLFLLGSAYVLYLLFVRRRPIALYMLAALFILFLPSTLALAFPIENPSNIRAAGLIPVMILLVALPVNLVTRRLTEALRSGTGTVLSLVLGAVLVVQCIQLNYRTYFDDYYWSYRRSAWNASDMARVIRGFGDSMGNIHDAYIIVTPYWIDHRAVALTLRDMSWNNLLMKVEEAQLHLGEPRNHLYLFKPENTEAEQWLREHYPQGQLWRFNAFEPEKDFYVFLALAQP